MALYYGLPVPLTFVFAAAVGGVLLLAAVVALVVLWLTRDRRPRDD
jgi:hypothetical protein